MSPFEFMEKPYWSWNESLSGSQWWRFGDPSLYHFWLIHRCDGQTDGETDRIVMAKTCYNSTCCHM